MESISFIKKDILVRIIKNIFSFLIFFFFLGFFSETFAAGSVDLAVIKTGPATAYNATNFTYTIILSNNGPDSAHGATFTDVLFSGAQSVNVTCTSTSGGASCPTFTTISNATVQGNIPTFPNGSSVTLEVTGRFPLLPPTSVRNEVTISPPSGVSELNSATNTAITNTQLTILPTDLAVTNFTQSLTGSIPTTSVTNTGTFSNDLFVTTPTPLTFTTTYTNNGSGAADSGTVSMSLYAPLGNFNMTYSGFTITCTATGGAVCPVNPYAGTILNISGSGTRSVSSSISIFNGAIVPIWPAGGSLTFTVTLTPVSFTYPYSVCGSATQTVSFRPYILSTTVPSGITDTVSGNNSYTNSSIATVATTPFGIVDFGTISQIACPQTDLAVTNFTQSFTGSIPTTIITNTGTFSNNLSVTTPTPLTFSATYTNQGSGSANGGTVGMALYGGGGTYMSYSGFTITCTATGGAVCPANPYVGSSLSTSGSGTVYVYTALTFFSGLAIPTWPSGGSVTFTVTFTPNSFTASYGACGSNSSTVTLRPYYVNTAVPTGVTDTVSGNNSYVNSAISTIASTPIGDVTFGTVTQITCPQTDLAVTNFTQSLTGSIPTTSVTNTGTFSNDLFVTTPTPLTFSATYTNQGSGSANGGTVLMMLNGGSAYMTYSGFTITCTATGGAVCPANPYAGTIFNTSGSGTRYLPTPITIFSNVAIPTWPAGGSVTFTVTITPNVFTYPYTVCGNGTQSEYLRIYSLNANVPTGVTETVSGNNSYSNSNISTIASTPTGDITFGTISQMKCTPTDLLTTVTETSDILLIGEPFSAVFTYTNNGTGTVYDTTLLGEKRTYSYFDSQYKFIDYKDYTLTCTASGGAICPTFTGTGYGGNISLGTGTFSYYGASPYYYTLFSTKAPAIPPGGSIIMTASYTPTLLRTNTPPIICGSTTQYLTYSNFTSTVSNPLYTDSNSTNNTRTLVGNSINCIDLYVTNTLSNSNPPPNSSFTISLQVGNAGAGGGSGVYVTNIIPAGFVYDSATCTAGGGAICGPVNFNPTTRLFSSTVSYIPKDGTVTFTLSGSAINYSSSWKSDTLAQLGDNFSNDASGSYVIQVSSGVYINQMGSGIFERIPSTNVARLSFTVEGIDPTVSKIASVHSAKPGDTVEYTLYIKNPASGAILANSSLYDPLPLGFTYLSTNSVTLSGATQTAFLGTGANDPLISVTSSGQGLTWGNYTLLPEGSIIVSFSAKVNSIIACGTGSRDNSAYYDYTLPTLVVGESFYDGTLIGRDQDDVVITCTPILAQADSGTSIEINSGSSITPTSINLLTNDTLSGSQATSSGVVISLLSGSTFSGNVLTGTTLLSSGILSWPTSSASGVYFINYEICEIQNIYNCSTAQAKVTIARLPRPIQANADSGTFLNTNTGTISLLDNDTFSGSQAHTGVVTLSLTGVNSLTGSFLDSDKNLIIPQNTQTGIFILNYEICEILSPTNCSTAEITVTITAPTPSTPNPIQANADSGTFLNTNTGTISLLDNDTFSGSQAHTGVVTLSLTGVNSLTGSFLDSDKNLIIPSGTQTGVFTLNYEICEILSPTNCSTAEITITIEAFIPTPIQANADSGTFLNTNTGTISLLDNDTFSGSQASTGFVNITLTGSNPLPNSYMNSDGILIIPSGTQTGVFTLNYEICEILSPTNCSTAEITITIEAFIPTPIQANADSGTFLNTNTGTISLLDNDTFSGSQAHTGVVTLSLTGVNSLTGSFLDSDKNLIIPSGTQTGVFTLNYEICEILSPTNCSTAEITITIEAFIPTPIQANADSGTFLNTNTGTISLLDNDTFSGSQAHTGVVTLSLTGVNSLTGSFLDSDKNLIIPSGTQTGVFTLNYEICEILSPTNCSNTTITITIESSEISLPFLDARDDFGIFLNTNTGMIDLLQNDIFSGGTATLADTFIFLTGALEIPDAFIDGSGVFILPSSSYSGTYTFSYILCEILDASHCDTANIFVTLETLTTPIHANPDTKTLSEGNSGTINILQNDTFSGAQAETSAVTLSLLSDPIPDSFLDLDTGILTISASTPAGEYSLEYKICEILSPTNCSTASITVTITAIPPAENTGTTNTGTTPVVPSSPSGTASSGPGGPSPYAVDAEYIPPYLTENPHDIEENSGTGESPVPSEATTSTPRVCSFGVFNINDTRLKTYANELMILGSKNFSHTLTRREFLAIAFRAGNITIPPAEILENMGTGITNISEDDVFSRSIQYAIQLGIISGQVEDFRPDDPISRAEATKILLNTFHVAPVSPTGIFGDVPRSNTLAPYIESAYQHCIIHGKNTLNGELIPGNSYLLFEPWETISLGETLKILYNMTH